MRKSLVIEKCHNGFVLSLSDGAALMETYIASNEIELRLQVIKLLEKHYPDPIYADDYVAKDAK